MYDLFAEYCMSLYNYLLFVQIWFRISKYFLTIGHQIYILYDIQYMEEASMEKRKVNVMINKVGGNAGSGSLNYRVSIPSSWANQLEITKEDRTFEMEFDGEKITLKKCK